MDLRTIFKNRFLTMGKQFFAQEISGHFNLRKPKSDRPTNIYFVVNIGGKQIKIPTGVRIYPHHWNRSKQQPLISSALSELDNHNNAIVLSAIKAIKMSFLRYIDYLCDHPDELHKAKELATKLISPMAKKEHTPSPLAVIKNGVINNTTIKESSKERHISRMKPFEQFLKDHKIELESFDQINRSMILEYRTYLQKEYINPKGQKNKSSHINTLTSELKTLFKSYAVPDYISSSVVDDIFNKTRLTVRVDNRNNEIALRDDEIYKLYHYKAKTEQDERIKDTFIINCLTGQRISDIDKIEPYIDPDSGAKRIMLYQKKGSTKVKFDIVFQLAEDILIKKYGGKLPLKKATNTLISSNIPRIAREAGIQGEELVSDQRGDATDITVTEKERWELVKTHTERRTFITLLKLRGWDNTKVKKFSGHKDSAMIDHYCKLEPSDYSDFSRLKRNHPELVLQFTETYREEPSPTYQAPIQSANDTKVVLDSYTAQIKETALTKEQLEYLKRTRMTKEQWEQYRKKAIKEAAKRGDFDEIDFLMTDPLKWEHIECDERPEGEWPDEPTEEDLEKWAKMDAEWEEQHKKSK